MHECVSLCLLCPVHAFFVCAEPDQLRMGMQLNPAQRQSVPGITNFLQITDYRFVGVGTQYFKSAPEERRGVYVTTGWYYINN